MQCTAPSLGFTKWFWIWMLNGPVFPVQKRNHKHLSGRFLYIISAHLSKSYYSHRSFLIHTWHCIRWNHKGNVLILEEQILLQFCIPSNGHIENREYFMVFRQEEWLWFGEALLGEGQGEGSNSIPGTCISPLSFLTLAVEVQDLASRKSRRAFTLITPLREGY